MTHNILDCFEENAVKMDAGGVEGSVLLYKGSFSTASPPRT